MRWAARAAVGRGWRRGGSVYCATSRTLTDATAFPGVGHVSAMIVATMKHRGSHWRTTNPRVQALVAAARFRHSTIIARTCGAR